jgi:putative aldouronate transport system substrate-binding protein
MKRLISRSVMLFFASVLLISQLGCSATPKANIVDEAVQEENQALPEAQTEGAMDESEVSGTVPDPLGKYDPAITITAARALNENTTFPEGDSIEDNIWIRTYAEELGINLEYEWIAPSGQYADRANVSIMSNQLPDIIQVNTTQLQRMVENEQVADLTDVYNQFASELTKSIITAEGNSVLESCSFDGKIVALPKTGSALGATHVLWIRSDWLQNLGLSAPESMDDVVAIAKAFTDDDPDGNGLNDTYGLGLYKDLYGYFAGLQGFFNGFHAYPGQWVEDNGQLVYSSIQPETKAALQTLQSMFNDRLIDPEFGTKDAGKVAQDANAGKVGMFYGFFWNAGNGWLQDGKLANPELEWTPFAIVSADDQPALVQVPFIVDTFWVVSSESEHPEAAIKLMNLMYEKIFGVSGEPGIYSVDSENHSVFEYPLIYGEPPAKNLTAQQKVVDALQKGDISKLNNEEMSYYNNILVFQEGDLNQWGTNKMYGDGGSLSVINGYLENNTFLVDAFYGAATPTMAEKNVALDKLELETFTKIIMGGDISEFDSFVSNWQTLGGMDITEEVNDWYASH